MKARVIQRMNELANRAKLAVARSLINNASETEDKESKFAIASVITNAVFGEEPQEEHKEQFNIEEITKIASNLLLNDAKTKELAIQSIRVINIINITNKQEPIGINLLEEYGHEFPDAPTPEDYEQIIIKYEIANGIEPIPNSNSYSNSVNNEINNLRNENPWYLWPFRIIFWVVIVYSAYWLFS